MSYPSRPGMPPLPNSNASPNHPSYPVQLNSSMQMPSYPTQSMQQAGFVPPQPAPSAYPIGYPSTSTAFYPPPNSNASQSHPVSSAYPNPYPNAHPNAYSNAFPNAYPSANLPSHTTVYLPPNPNSFQPQPSPISNQSTYPPSAKTVYPQSNPNASSHIPTPNSQQGYSGLPQQKGYSGYGYQQVSTSVSLKNPTVVPASCFDPVADAKALRKAMKGLGTDEDALIKIICRRSNEQRQIIQRTYKTQVGRDLIEDVRSETSGNFKKLLVVLLTPIVDFYVKELHDAMAGIGTDEDVLIEDLCSLSNKEIHIIKNAYARCYGKSLEDELISDTSGNFKRLLVSLCACGRDESGVVNREAATHDAAELLRAGESRFGTDESTFIMILCERNFAQIKLISEEYQKLTGHGLEKAIKNEFSGDIKNGLLAILQCTIDRSQFFAEQLHKSMVGLGTNDAQLIRLVVTRCEIDLKDIKSAFERLYGKSLGDWIKGETSGHYKHALYALIGEGRLS